MALLAYNSSYSVGCLWTCWVLMKFLRLDIAD